MPIIGNLSSGGKKPSTPTIGTASDGGTGTTASVAFTPSSYIGKGTITYTALSNPGSLTGTGSGSPITVSGLTTGTAYTFTVNGTTNYGVSSNSSAASNSVTPASPTSFESIATVTASGSTTSVSFTSIPGTYKFLQIRGIGRNTDTSTAQDNGIKITFNSDSATNYTNHAIVGNGTSVTAYGYTARNYIYAFEGVPNSTSNSGFGSAIIDVIDYASTSKNKTTRIVSGSDVNQGTANFGVALSSGLWLSTAAITSITLTSGSGNWTSGSTFALYGIK